MIKLTPFASKIATNSNITFTFDVSTFRIHLLFSYGIYCRSNDSNASYPATVISATNIFCEFPALNIREIFIEIFMKIPSITSKDIILSKNQIPFYYLCN